jgi:hypothetical protein
VPSYDAGSEPPGKVVTVDEHGGESPVDVDEDTAAPPAEGPSAAELLIGLVDGTVSQLARRPVRVRTKVTPAGALRGRIDVIVFEVGGLRTTGLVIDRLVVRAEQVRVEPGLPPRLKAGPLGFKATVAQAAVDRWTKASHLPVRLLLTPEGVVAKTSVRGIQLSEVEVELDVAGPLIQLRPRRAAMLGVETPVLGLLRGYLPLPPLPMGARLRRVEAGDGTLTTWFSVPDVDEPLTPDLALRLQRRLVPRLPFS